MRGSPLIPRAEMHLWRAGRGADLILKDEWRPNQRSLSFFPPPAPCTPAPLPRFLPPHPYPASLPRAYTYICMRKAPGSSPIWGGEAGGLLTLSVTALSHAPAAVALATGRLRLGCLIAGEHRCGCGQFSAGHERGAESGELACVAFGHAEQGQQLGGRVGHDGL